MNEILVFVVDQLNIHPRSPSHPHPTSSTEFGLPLAHSDLTQSVFLVMVQQTCFTLFQFILFIFFFFTGVAALPESYTWRTLSGSNSRAGATPLLIPIHTGAPMTPNWSTTINGTCTRSLLADVRGWIWVMCQIKFSNQPTQIQPTLYAFQATNDSIQPVWQIELDPFTLPPIEEQVNNIGSLALTQDQLWLVVSTRSSVYGVSALFGTIVWKYPFMLLTPAIAVGSGLSIATPTWDQWSPAIFVSLNLGVASLRNGILLWQYQTTSTGKPNEWIDIAAPALDELNHKVVYTYFRETTSNITLVVLDSDCGLPKWSYDIPVSSTILAMIHTRGVPHPVLSDQRVILSVGGYELMLFDINTGERITSDSSSPGRLVQAGVPPVYLPDAEVDEGGMIYSVCMNPPCTGKGSDCSNWQPDYQLCFKSYATGAPINLTSGDYRLGCNNASGDFDPRPPIAQPLIGGNKVILVALSQSEDGRSSGCLNVLPLFGSSVKRWSHDFHSSPNQLFHHPIQISPNQLIGLLYDDGHDHQSYQPLTTIWSLQSHHEQLTDEEAQAGPEE